MVNVLSNHRRSHDRGHSYALPFIHRQTVASFAVPPFFASLIHPLQQNLNSITIIQTIPPAPSPRPEPSPFRICSTQPRNRMMIALSPLAAARRVKVERLGVAGGCGCGAVSGGAAGRSGGFAGGGVAGGTWWGRGERVGDDGWGRAGAAAGGEGVFLGVGEVAAGLAGGRRLLWGGGVVMGGFAVVVVMMMGFVGAALAAAVDSSGGLTRSTSSSSSSSGGEASMRWVGLGVVGAVELSVRVSVQSAHFGGLFVAIGTDVVVEAAFPSLFFLLALLLGFFLLCNNITTTSSSTQSLACLLASLSLLVGLLFDHRRLTAELRHGPIFIAVAARHHTPTTKSRALGSIAQRLPVWAFPSEYGALVVVPVAFAPLEAAVFGPEEEPDCCQDEEDADNGKEGLDTFHINGIWGHGARAEGRAGWSRGAGEDFRACG